MKRPDTTLRPASHRDLIEQVEQGETRLRMYECERRRMVLEDDWRPLVYGALVELGYSPELSRVLAARVRRSSNVAAKVLRKVALAYRQPPHRTIANASDETQRAFRKLYLQQAKLTTLPQSWERAIWLLGVVITVPVVYPSKAHPFGMRLAYERLTGANTEVVTDEDSASADPIASVTTLVPRGASVWTDKRYLVIDAAAWTTYDAQGRMLSRVEHGAGIWPGTVWRREYGADWWVRDTAEGLIEATVDVAHIAARLRWIRQGQDHKREFLFSEHAERIPHQIAGADAPIHIPLAEQDAKYLIEDASVPIDQHVAHMVREARDGVESIGVDPDLVDYSVGPDGVDILESAHKHDDLVALREATIEHLRLSETDSAYKTALVLQGARHPESRLLRPETVRDHYEAHWGELDFVVDPATRLQVLEHEIDLGLKSTIDAFMAQHRGLSREDARKEVLRIIDEESEIADILVQRNQPRLLRDRRGNLAELQGRIGGMASGDSRNAVNDDSERRSQQSERGGSPAAPSPSRGPAAGNRARGRATASARGR